MMFDLILASFASIFKILLSLCLIPFRFLGYRLSIYSSSSFVEPLLINLKNNALILEDNHNPRDFSFGRWYIAYISVTPSEHGSNTTVYLFSTVKKAAELTTSKELAKTKDQKNEDITTVTRLCKTSGAWWGYNWSEYRIQNMRISPRESQSELVDSIMDYYNGHPMKRCIAFIDGPPGTGKSSISRILASRLQKAFICDEFNPLLAGDMYSPLYQSFKKIGQGSDSTLILVIDEIDKLIAQIENHPSYSNKYSIQVTGKSSWNSLLDRISNYDENIIVLLTSNTDYDKISNDKSYLRQGRVDLRFTLTKSECKHHPMDTDIFSV